MAGKFILAVFAVVALFVQSTTAVTYTVGDNLGWTVPPSPNTYPSWASPITFRVGDILVFNFASGAHDVATVTKQAIDSCNTNSPITMQTIAPVAFSLNNIGEIHFICTFGSHCSLGQKFSINVTSAAPAPGAPSPPTTPVPAAPMPPTTTPMPPTTTPVPATPTPSVTPTTPAPESSSLPPSASTQPPMRMPGGPTVSPSASPNPSTTSPPGAATPPGSSSPSPTTTTPTPPNAPPPPSSATRSSLTVVGFMGTLMAIAMGLTL
ncbi:blue copper protein-like isoform X2 [Impatiens glandulifera]|uniref:blue copper protein-like isoform X2 n=1 Tax=Impatiens glandulifera TaxID=253017 RepID=UPI001FB0AF23|nr:blue copper protein-like isoform X2 [Impatiens glandulifera]